MSSYDDFADLSLTLFRPRSVHFSQNLVKSISLSIPFNCAPHLSVQLFATLMFSCLILNAVTLLTIQNSFRS
jgi:hypothetical protein